MGNGVNPIPEGFHTVTPYMTIKDAASAIEFYKEAFGATEIFRWADPDGRVRHAEVVIGDSPSCSPMKPRVRYERPAIARRLASTRVPLRRRRGHGRPGHRGRGDRVDAGRGSEDGDRRGGVTDPFGHVWYIGTHIEGISREELQKRYDTFAGR